MAPLTDTMEKAVLDWVTGGAAVTRPTTRWISWATQSPTSQSAFDGPFQSRFTCTFAAANSPQMSVTNLNALSAVTATAIATVLGWNLWNSSSGGTRLAYGTMTASVGMASADIISVAAGSLKITLT